MNDTSIFSYAMSNIASFAMLTTLGSKLASAGIVPMLVNGITNYLTASDPKCTAEAVSMAVLPICVWSLVQALEGRVVVQSNLEPCIRFILLHESGTHLQQMSSTTKTDLYTRQPTSRDYGICNSAFVFFGQGCNPSRHR